MRPWLLLVCACLGLATAAAGGDAPAADPERPRVDPLARPPLERATRPDEAAPSSDAAPWTPVLRGTLVSGEGSLVDLGGVVLRIGEGYEGWWLREVKPFEAVFERDGKTVLLPVTSGDTP